MLFFTDLAESLSEDERTKELACTFLVMHFSGESVGRRTEPGQSISYLLTSSRLSISHISI
jgi:hypothetical protein